MIKSILPSLGSHYFLRSGGGCDKGVITVYQSCCFCLYFQIWKEFSLPQNKTLLHDLNLFPPVGIFLESSTLGMPIYISGLGIIWQLLFELLSQFRWLNSCNIHPRNPFWVPDSENSLMTGHFHFGDSSHDILLCSLLFCHSFFQWLRVSSVLEYWCLSPLNLDHSSSSSSSGYIFLSSQKHPLPLGSLLMPLILCAILSKCSSQLQF